MPLGAAPLIFFIAYTSIEQILYLYVVWKERERVRERTKMNTKTATASSSNENVHDIAWQWSSLAAVHRGFDSFGVTQHRRRAGEAAACHSNVMLCCLYAFFLMFLASVLGCCCCHIRMIWLLVDERSLVVPIWTIACHFHPFVVVVRHVHCFCSTSSHPAMCPATWVLYSWCCFGFCTHFQWACMSVTAWWRWRIGWSYRERREYIGMAAETHKTHTAAEKKQPRTTQKKNRRTTKSRQQQYKKRTYRREKKPKRNIK